MTDSRGLLYPALHKFYSALNSLQKFEKGTNFFDNIGYLDSFFSEYRNITFVLQKSIAHSEYVSAYESLRDQYLVNQVGKWFVDTRNKVLKQHPFDLEKRIVVTIYSGINTISFPELVFTIENDVPYSTIIESLKQMFLDSGEEKIMFSTEFFFYERGYLEDLYDNFILGISNMKKFMSAMRMAVNEDCALCDVLISKIDEMNFYRVPKDFLFVDDYVFYSVTNSFEKASRVTLTLGTEKRKTPVENLNRFYPPGDLLTKFEVMHLVTFQMQKNLLPTCLLLHGDDTFELVTFGFSIKTTVYRKFHEIANRIANDKITRVLFVTEMFVEKWQDEHKPEEQIENQKKKEIVAFFSIDKELNMNAHKFDSSLINDFKYLAAIMFSKSTVTELPEFMNPLILEFKRLNGESVIK